MVVGLFEQVDRLLDRSTGACESPLVDGELGTAGINGCPEPLDGEVREFLGYALQALPDVVELASHVVHRSRDRRRPRTSLRR